MDLTGIIYFPNSEVEFTGGSEMDEADVLLVASTLKITGNTYLNADYARACCPSSTTRAWWSDGDADPLPPRFFG